MNSFEFHSVGQGLFYTGSLMHKTYNFVYDCGTENKIEYLEQEIDDYVESIKVNNYKPNIEFVVISHLHRDHFNGLRYLVDKSSIKKIYLPYLGENPFIIRMTLAFSIYSLDREDDEDYQLKDQLFHFMAALYQIESDNGYSEICNRVSFIDKNGQTNLQQCYTMTFYASSKSIFNRYWKFNLIQSTINGEKLKKLYFYLKKLCDDYIKIDIIQMMKNDNSFIEKIAEVYRKIFGKGNELNLTSLMLMHYPLYSNAIAFYSDINIDICEKKYCFCRNKMIHPRNCRQCVEKSSNTISVLTGDAMIDGSMLKEMRYLSKEQDYFVFQIPHHGSIHNWYIIKGGVTSENYIISFGYGNKYKHPSVGTINDLLMSHKKFYCVTQKDKYKYYIF